MSLTSTALLEFFELGAEGERASSDRERAEEREGSQKNVEVGARKVFGGLDAIWYQSASWAPSTASTYT